MAWIKITHISGSTYINTNNINIFEQTSSTDVTFYSSNSAASSTYTFSTSLELTEFISNLSSLLNIIDINRLAPQK